MATWYRSARSRTAGSSGERVLFAANDALIGALAAPVLALLGVVAGLVISARNADRQTGATVLKIGHDALIDANVTLVRERDEARAERDEDRELLAERDREVARLRAQLLENGITPRGRQSDD